MSRSSIQVCISVRVALAGALAAAVGACSTPSETRDADSAARLRIAQVAEQSGRPDLALNLLAAAAEAAPRDAAVQARYGNALSRAGRDPEAEVVLQAALRLAPNNPDVHVAMGRLRVRGDRLQEALSHFERAAALAPRLIAALDGQGVVLDLMGRHEEAQRSYRAALSIAADDPVVSNNLAFSLLLTGRAEEAVALLRPLANRPDVTPRILNNLAIALAAAGRPEEGAAISPEGMTAASLLAVSRALAASAAGGMPRPAGDDVPPATQSRPQSRLPPAQDEQPRRAGAPLPLRPAAELVPAPRPPRQVEQQSGGALARQPALLSAPLAQPQSANAVRPQTAAPTLAANDLVLTDQPVVRLASMNLVPPARAVTDAEGEALPRTNAALPPPAAVVQGDLPFYVQFSAHRSERVALVSLDRLRGRYAALVEEVGVTVQPAVNPSVGAVWRVRSRDFASAGEARDVCNRAIRAGLACFVARS